MPTAKNLKRLLDAAVDDTVQNPVALDYFNSALRDLAPVARIPGKVVLPFTKEAKTITLPEDIVEIRRVIFIFNNGRIKELPDLADSYGVEVVENVSIDWLRDLEDDGVLTLRYYRYPVELASLEDTPEIPAPYHDALVHYGTREYLDADDEDGSKANDKYQTKKAELDMFTRSRGVTSQPALSHGRPPWGRR